jgi:ESF2/ABP1 family protein
MTSETPQPSNHPSAQDSNSDSISKDISQTDDATDIQADNLPTKHRTKKVRQLNLSTTTNFNETLSNRGVIYLSRVPPRMTPSKISSLLSDFGPVTRIYLVEEDKTVRKKRRKAGGSGGKRYVEGWVEFESKKVARRVGEMLNMSRVTNHKRSLHYDDFWNIKVSCMEGFASIHSTVVHLLITKNTHPST